MPLVPLVLDHNLRNTKQIAEVFRPLAPLRMRLEGGDGPEVLHVPASPEEALDVADDGALGKSRHAGQQQSTGQSKTNHRQSLQRG